jgi:tetratricopeptide (TPR) repeat protein
VERTLKAGEAHRYEVACVSKAPWLLTVEQRGIDVVLHVTGARGESLATVDNPLGREGTESWLGPARPGTYRVEVRAREPAVGPGAYTLRVDRLGEATTADRLRLDAERALSEAGGFSFRSATQRQAIARYRLAAALWRVMGQRRQEADAIHAAAVLTRRGQKPRPALALYRQALALWETVGDEGRTASALDDMGLLHWQLGELSAAEASFARALALDRSSGRRYPEAEVLHNQCLIAHSRGDLPAAIACYTRAYARFRDLGEAKQEAVALNNIGFADYSRGEPQQALAADRQALAIRRRIGDREGVAQSLNNIAVVFRSVGETQKALSTYQQVRQILEPLHDRRQEAAVLHNIGVAYFDLGELGRARVYLEQALALRRQVEDRSGEASTRNNLGRLFFRDGQLAPARDAQRQALALAEGASDRRGAAIIRIDLAKTLAAVGDRAAALGALDRAREDLEKVGDRLYEARALHQRGEVLLTAGRLDEAVESLLRALALRRAVDDREGEAATLAALARARRDRGDRGDLRRALSDAEAAVAIVESLRSRVASPQLRASFFGSRHEPYEILIDLMMDLHAAEPAAGWERRALEVSEAAHARSLLDLLNESGADIRKGIDPILQERRRALERRLNAKATRQLELLGRGKSGSPEANALGLEIPSILAELEEVEAEIRRHNPAYAALTRPPPLTARQIQAQLDPGTILLEVSLGDDRSFLWRVDPRSVAVFALPGRKEIEAAARRAYELLSAPSAGDGQPRQEAMAALSQMVLGPVRAGLGDGLDGTRLTTRLTARLTARLAIVADGALQLIPFAALPAPGEQEPLVLRHEVVHLPSVSALAAQRRQLAGRRPAPLRAAVLADPVFDPRDPRVGSPASGIAPGALTGFDRLPLTRQEALAIAALAPQRDVLTALSFEANRELVTGSRLHEYRIVHFATHGLIDAAHPALSGLVLSLVDERGRPQDGLLRLHDVYNLDLPAELVVLSGCRTALGREIRGEGLWGLSHGFLYAGARRVVASLWWVEDRSTAELMTRFYRAMWEEDLRPAAALRKAQLAMLADRRFHDPFAWAAFVCQGDWR